MPSLRMIVIKNLVHIDKELAEPVYQQLANGIVSLIRQGHLKPGAALPSSRKLAETFDLHRKTVVAAFDELQAQGWAESLPRRGLFVAEQLPVMKPQRLSERAVSRDDDANGGMDSDLGAAGSFGAAGSGSAGAAGSVAAGSAGSVTAPGNGIRGSLVVPPAKPAMTYPAKTDFPVEKIAFQYDHFFVPKTERLIFSEGLPDTRLAPVDMLIREYRRFGNYRFTARFLSYGPEQGSVNLRNELARFLNVTRGLAVSPANILITKGAQMGMYLLSQLLIKKGDAVVVGEPGYVGASEVFQAAGADLQLVRVDEDGLDIDEVEKLCRRKKVKLVYVVPHHHMPTAVALCPERRQQLLALAREYSFAILEDDYDFDFQYSSSPILPLASIDTCGNVIYIGSFSKTIAPAIRIGFLVAPVNLVEEATRLRRLIDRQGELLMEEAMANLLRNGDIDRHLKKANKIYHERRDLLCGLLTSELGSRVGFSEPSGGFAVYTQFHGMRTRDVQAAAARLGLGIGNGEDYWHDPRRREKVDAVRLGFASLNEKEMVEAVGLLKKAVR
jgi:GntR family transcriptional regulator/MocR family aminotransferase